MATIVLRLVKGTPLTNAEVDNNFSNLNVELGNVSSNVGARALLTTTATSNVVVAINEVLTRATSNVAITGGTISGIATLAATTANVTTANVTTANITTANIATINGNVAVFSNTVTALDFNSTSDISLKDNIQPISNPLEIINKLAGIEFTWKGTENKSFGLSAQSVEGILPDIVKTRQDGYKGINYNNLIAFLIEAVKDLSGQVQKLKTAQLTAQLKDSNSEKL
jgi:hypothetical protein